MKKIVFVFLFFKIGLCFSQSVSSQVINSAGGGGAVGTTGVEVYYNIGEPMISTITNGTNTITQGFLQADVAGEYGLTASAYITPASCADKTDGTIKITAQLAGVTDPGNFKISYYWNSPALCTEANTCSIVSNLSAGTYSVLIVAQYTVTGSTVPNDTVQLKDIVISSSAEPCQITVYNGFSPNGDGMNDIFFIENIGQFSQNKVEIFNRWGQKLADIKQYDNTTNVWTGTMGSGTTLAPSGTYFYVIDLGNGTAPIKGWLELTGQK